MKLLKILTLALIPMASIAMDPAEIEASLQAGILPEGVTIVAVTATTGLAHDVAVYPTDGYDSDNYCETRTHEDENGKVVWTEYLE